jgi:hypothetical protein
MIGVRLMPMLRSLSIRPVAVIVIGLMLGLPSATNDVRAAGGRTSLVQRLNTEVRLRLHHTPLRKALSALANTIGLALIIDKAGIKSAGVNPSTPITVDIHHSLTVRRAIELILLKATSHRLNQSTITWNVSKDALLIGPASWADQFTTVRIYNIAPLILVHVGGNVYRVSRRRVRQVCSLIENTIDRNAWVDNGGISNTDRLFGTCLIVSGIERDQLAILNLLAGLEKAAAIARGGTLN